MSLGDADRICVTTFAADGTATTSSEYVVRLGEDTVGIWTPHSTPWVDRLGHSHVVSVQAASGSGKALRTEPVFEGRAELVTEGDQLAEAPRSPFFVPVPSRFSSQPSFHRSAQSPSYGAGHRGYRY